MSWTSLQLQSTVVPLLKPRCMVTARHGTRSSGHNITSHQTIWYLHCPCLYCSPDKDEIVWFFTIWDSNSTGLRLICLLLSISYCCFQFLRQEKCYWKQILYFKPLHVIAFETIYLSLGIIMKKKQLLLT